MSINMVNAKLKYSSKFATCLYKGYLVEAGEIVQVPTSTFDGLSIPTVHGGGWDVSSGASVHADTGAKNIYDIVVDKV